MGDSEFFCTFCGRPRADVVKLIAGFDGLVCDSCIELCIRSVPPGPPESAVSIRPAGPEAPAPVVTYSSRRTRQFAPYPDRCSFCGKGQRAVGVFFQGYVSCICSECVLLCVDILADELEGAWAERQSALARSQILGPRS